MPSSIGALMTGGRLFSSTPSRHFGGLGHGPEQIRHFQPDDPSPCCSISSTTTTPDRRVVNPRRLCGGRLLSSFNTSVAFWPWIRPRRLPRGAHIRALVSERPGAADPSYRPRLNPAAMDLKRATGCERSSGQRAVEFVAVMNRPPAVVQPTWDRGNRHLHWPALPLQRPLRALGIRPSEGS